jgi:single-stranded DNA-binding protein
MSQQNFQQKDLTGVLFFNAYKDKDTQPNFKGKITIEGKEYSLSAWERKDKNGNNYYSLQATSPDEQQANAQSNIDRLKSAVFAGKTDTAAPAQAKPQQPKPMPAPDFDDDDDLPF